MLALLAAGCGGEDERAVAPALPAGLAAQLAERSDAVAAKLDAGDSCGALADAESLQQQTVEAINAGLVPPRYQEELASSVAALAGSIACDPPPPVTPAGDDQEDEEHEDDGKGKNKDKDKDKDEDKRDKDDDEDKGKGEGKGKGKGGKG